MMEKKNIQELSYLSQSKIFSDTSDEAKRLADTWFDETTADFWLHNRMYEAVDCLINDRSAKWLTVGDGRWGLDAIRIKKRGFKDVMPSDICETLLAESKKRGLIEDYRVENAEKLSFSDNFFDYVFCKESYHHFPRPYMALYEMLRVASKAVFLVEPNDDPLVSTVNVKNFLKYKVKAFLSRHGMMQPPVYYSKLLYQNFEYESSGNYVYSLSLREMQKMAQGMNFSNIVYKGYNTHYIKGCEFEPADEEKSPMFRQIKTTIAEQDKKCRLGLCTYSGIMLGIYKYPIDELSKYEFEQRDWHILDLSNNPYLNKQDEISRVIDSL